MITILRIITYVGTIIGFVILIKSLLTLGKARKKLKKVSNTEYFKEFERLGIKKHLKLAVLGISITTIMQLIRMFLL